MRILVFSLVFAVLAVSAKSAASLETEVSRQKVEQLATTASQALREMEFLAFTCTVTDSTHVPGQKEGVQSVHLRAFMAPEKLRMEVRNPNGDLLFAVGSENGRTFEYRPEFRLGDDLVLYNVVLEYDQRRVGGTDETFLRLGGPGADCHVGSFLYSWVGEHSARPDYVYELISSGDLHSDKEGFYQVRSSSRFEEGLDWMEVRQAVVLEIDKELPLAIHTSQASPEGSTSRKRDFVFHAMRKKGEPAHVAEATVLWDLSDLKTSRKEEVAE